MTLLQFQRAYARLVTDPAARESFAADPEAWARDAAGLADEDARRLAALASGGFAAAGERLDRERLERVRAHAPWTVLALGEPEALAAVRAYGRKRPGREETTLRETTLFLRWLAARARSVRRGPSWTADAIEYERAVVRLQLAAEADPAAVAPGDRPRLDSRAAVLVLDHDLTPLSRGDPHDVAAAPTGYVFHRPRRTRAVRVYRTEPDFARLLARADGTREPAALAAAAAAAAAAEWTPDAVAAALSLAADAGVLAAPPRRTSHATG